MERSGVYYETRETPLKFIGPQDQPLESGYTDPQVESLLLYDSSFPEERIIEQTVSETLDIMRVKYDKWDVKSPGAVTISKYKTVVLAFHKLDNMQQIHELIDWVEKGGRVLFAARPYISVNFRSLYRKLGMLSMADQDIVVMGLDFKTDLIPGAMGQKMIGSGDFLKFFAYPVQLDAASRVHISSADNLNLPLLWEVDYGQGHFVVFNTSQLAYRVNRGIIGAAYSLLQEAFIYPVINTSVYFLDNFPSPMPEGENEIIKKEFNRDIHSFFMDVWWPDMDKLSGKYGIKYTGLLVETYSGTTEPPFSLENTIYDHRYLGRLLLKNGGEIGLHGYNHIPLCLKEDGINKIFGYPDWPSIKEQQLAIKALNEAGNMLFPKQNFIVYAPPSYILCPEARQWLPKAFPQIKVITSLLIEEEPQSYVQDFTEAADGVIEFPRVVAGYYLYADTKLALINALALQYVNSHLITPDDILDPVRGADREWSVMRNQLDDQIKWVQDNAPGLRNMTAKEGAMAVQRYSRLKVNAVLDQSAYNIHLGNFYDEAFLMLRSYRAPVGITGGKITKVTSNLYLIEANNPDIVIQLGGNP